jgi:hypothetical protein
MHSKLWENGNIVGEHAIPLVSSIEKDAVGGMVHCSKSGATHTACVLKCISSVFIYSWERELKRLFHESAGHE